MAAGALVAAGLLLPLGVTPAATADGSLTDGKPTISRIAKSCAKAGPWIPSCMYWALLRKATNQETDSGDVSLSLDANHANVSLNTQAEKDDDDPGGYAQEEMTSAGLQADTSAGWRFPASEDDLKVHPMIAILTDPVHAHQALSLVREIGEASGGEKEKHSSVQPGLISFRPHGREKDGNASGLLSPVIYLFLIGATPTQGVDGTELSNAFKYEQGIHEIMPGIDLSAIEGSNYGNMIGPENSGSASPLWNALKQAERNHGGKGQLRKAKSFYMARTTQTPLSGQILTESSDLDAFVAPPQAISFAENAEFEGDQFLNSSDGFELPLSSYGTYRRPHGTR
jgi:hypothetical protein